MSVPIPLEGLAAQLERRSNAAYLLTVGDAERAHCVAVALEWQGDELSMRVGTTSARNAGASGHATLLSPPVPPAGLVGPSGGADDAMGGGKVGEASLDGYSLIVDVDVMATNLAAEGGGSLLRARPTHAVLHRPAFRPNTHSEDGCVHDCVHVYDEVARPD